MYGGGGVNDSVVTVTHLATNVGTFALSFYMEE